MLFGRHAHESSEFFTLGAGGQHHHFFRWIFINLLHWNDRFFPDLKHTGQLGYFDIRFHASALNHNFPPESFNDLEHFDDSLELRGEHPDNPSPLHRLDNVAEIFVNFALGRREARVLDVSGVGHEQQGFPLVENAVRFFLLDRRFAIYTIEIAFIIARVHNSTIGSFDKYPHRIGDGVGDAEEMNPEIANLDPFFFLHHNEIKWREVREFFLPFLNHKRGQIAGIDWGVANFWQHIRDTAGVIEGAVSDDDPPYPRFVFFEISGVGDNVIDTRSLVIRESEANVDHHNIAIHFDGSHVFTNFFNSA